MAAATNPSAASGELPASSDGEPWDYERQWDGSGFSTRNYEGPEPGICYGPSLFDAPSSEGARHSAWAISWDVVQLPMDADATEHEEKHDED